MPSASRTRTHRAPLLSSAASSQAVGVGLYPVVALGQGKRGARTMLPFLILGPPWTTYADSAGRTRPRPSATNPADRGLSVSPSRTRSSISQSPSASRYTAFRARLEMTAQTTLLVNSRSCGLLGPTGGAYGCVHGAWNHQDQEDRNANRSRRNHHRRLPLVGKHVGRHSCRSRAIRNICRSAATCTCAS